MESITISEIARALGIDYHGSGAIDHVCTDSRDITQGGLFVAIEGDNFDGHDYIDDAFLRGASCAIARKPGDYNGTVLYVEDTRKAHIKIGGLYRDRFDLKIVGITGSVGKTTTKEFLAAVLSSQFNTHKNEGNLNNEIGLPKTLFKLSHAHQAAVIEMGMSGFGEIHDLATAVHPDMGIITNIGVSHLEKLGSREGILKAKLELLDGMKKGSYLILCGDDPFLRKVSDDRFLILRYGINDTCSQIRAMHIIESEREINFTIFSPWGEYRAHIPTIGLHNVYNALAAFTAGCLMGIAPAQCADALSFYATTGMRQRMVDFGGVTIVEDCYNASPDSMVAAINTLAGYPAKGRKIMVLSDMLELGEISKKSHIEVGKFVARAGINLLFTCGSQAMGYIEGAESQGMERCLYYTDRVQLAQAVHSAIRPGDVVWFKASRGMELEKVLALIYGEPAAAAH